MRRVDIDAAQARMIAQGGRPAAPEGLPPGPVALAFEDRLLAIGEVRDGRLAPRKVFHA
jgi:hypothetical protein